jgi:SAM-dependent methyltransferase
MIGSYDSIQISGGDTGMPLNIAKRLTLIAHHVRLPGARILDAGCGAGEYVVALASAAADVRGVEYSADKVAQWRATHPGDDRVQEGDISKLPFADGAFDAILLNEVLEHVPSEAGVLRELHRVLRPRGQLLLFSPNRLYPFETHGVDRRNAGPRIPPLQTFGLPYLPLWLTRRLVRPWARNYWPRELRLLLSSAGYRVVAHSFVWQTFENISRQQGPALRRLAPLLRRVAGAAERMPVLRAIGASQFLVAEKQ